MATYEELYSLHSDNDPLIQKIAVANWIAADAIRVESAATPNHANRLLWAKDMLNTPGLAPAQQMLNAVLAQNKSLTVAQINGASDADIQTAVDAAVDLVAGS